MSILEKVNDNRNNRRVTGPNKGQVKVAIADGMAKVHSLDKPEWIRNCAQLGDHFSNFVMQRYTILEVMKWDKFLTDMIYSRGYREHSRLVGRLVG